MKIAFDDTLIVPSVDYSIKKYRKTYELLGMSNPEVDDPDGIGEYFKGGR